MPSDGNDLTRVALRKQHSELLYALADYFDNSFVIDLEKYKKESEALCQSVSNITVSDSDVVITLTTPDGQSYTQTLTRPTAFPVE